MKESCMNNHKKMTMGKGGCGKGKGGGLTIAIGMAKKKPSLPKIAVPKSGVKPQFGGGKGGCGTKKKSC